MKETRLFTCKAPPRVFEFFEAHTFNPDGKRISRGALLEQMVAASWQEPLNCHRCLEEGRSRYSYFEIGGVPVCMPCFLWEPPTQAELYKKAHDMVAAAKANGSLIEQPCEICGSVIDVEAHHDNYSKPLEVRWLCIQHHRQHHRLIGWKRNF